MMLIYSLNDVVLYDDNSRCVVLYSCHLKEISFRHTLFFPPIGHHSSHLVSDQGLSACILEFENIYIINMIQHQINSSSTDHHEHPWAKLVSSCFYHFARTFVKPSFCFITRRILVIFLFSPLRTVASGKERGFIFLDVGSSSFGDVPNPWHKRHGTTVWNMVPMTLMVSALTKAYNPTGVTTSGF